MPSASEDLPDLSRVVVVGTSCSGKTTFAHDLAALLGVPHVELDALYWLPGWIERDTSEFLALVDEKTAGDVWVTDGNYRDARDRLWLRATAVVWLDYPFPLVFWRALKRTFSRAVTGAKVCGDNRETWRKALLSRDSILLWVISTYEKRRRDYSALFAGQDYLDATKIRLTSPAEARRFLSVAGPG